MDNISDEHMLEAYMGGLHEDIKHKFFLKHTKNIMEAMQFACHIQVKNRATHKYTNGKYACTIYRFGAHRETLPQPTQISPREMEETRAKRLSFYCNKKWSKGNKCQETKLFTLENNDEEEMEASIQRDEEEIGNLKVHEKNVEITNKKERCEIYIHALVGLSTHQTLKIA